MPNQVRCYAMYGLIGGPFPYGLYYSGGLDVLADKLRALGPGIEVLPTFGWSEWKKIVADVRAQPEQTRVVVYGHSMGANQAAAVAAALGGRIVDLIAAFDPTIWYPADGLGANVRHAIWFHGTNVLSPFGHGSLKTAAGFNGKFEKFDIGDRHEIIDDNTGLHDITLDAVRALMN